MNCSFFISTLLLLLLLLLRRLASLLFHCISFDLTGYFRGYFHPTCARILFSNTTFFLSLPV